MPRRTALTLWTAVAAAVFLLGSLVATIRRLLAGGTFGDCVALAFALTGMLGALLVAGRIVFVSARASRRSRPG